MEKTAALTRYLASQVGKDTRWLNRDAIRNMIWRRRQSDDVIVNRIGGDSHTTWGARELGKGERFY